LAETSVIWRVGSAEMLPATCRQLAARSPGSPDQNVLANRPQSDVEERDQCNARTKAYQHKFLSVPQHFSEEGVRSQIDESAANLRHDQAEPEHRNVRQKKISDHSAKKCGRFNRGYPAERGTAM